MAGALTAKEELGVPRERNELVALLFLGVPLAGAQIAQVLMSISDSVMLGRLNSAAMAAGSLASNIAIVFLVMSFGLLASIPPLIAEARGREERAVPRQIMLSGLWLASGVSVIVVLALFFITPFLILIGEEPALAHDAGAYARAFAWGIPAALWTATFRLTLAALERPRPALVILLVALMANILLNWVLIFGHWGAPALGLAGSGYATAIVNWTMAIALACYIRFCRVFPKAVERLRAAEFRRHLRALLDIGWPVAAISAVELTLFSGAALLMGFFGPAALAAHQICIGIASLTFMVPMSLGQAASVRVGLHRGAGRMIMARHAGYVALALGTGFMICSSIALWLGSYAVLSLYVRPADPERSAVLFIGHRLLIAAAIFQVFDGAQAVASGALRGLKDTRIPMLVGAIGYWALGLPVGYLIAFTLGFGPIGLWIGFILGLSITAILLNLRFATLTKRLIASAPGQAALLAAEPV